MERVKGTEPVFSVPDRVVERRAWCGRPVVEVAWVKRRPRGFRPEIRRVGAILPDLGRERTSQWIDNLAAAEPFRSNNQALCLCQKKPEAAIPWAVIHCNGASYIDPPNIRRLEDSVLFFGRPASLFTRCRSLDMRLVHASLGAKIPAASCHLYLFPPPNLGRAFLARVDQGQSGGRGDCRYAP